MVDLRGKDIKAGIFVSFMGDTTYEILIKEHGQAKFEQICKEALKFVWDKNLEPRSERGWRRFIHDWFKNRREDPSESFQGTPKANTLKKLNQAYKGFYQVPQLELINDYILSLSEFETEKLVRDCIAKEKFPPAPEYFKTAATALIRAREPERTVQEMLADPRDSKYLWEKLIPDVEQKHGIKINNTGDLLKHWKYFKK